MQYSILQYTVVYCSILQAVLNKQQILPKKKLTCAFNKQNLNIFQLPQKYMTAACRRKNYNLVFKAFLIGECQTTNVFQHKQASSLSSDTKVSQIQLEDSCLNSICMSRITGGEILSHCACPSVNVSKKAKGTRFNYHVANVMQPNPI